MSPRIPFTVRDKNVNLNNISGMNFDDININTVIKKVDDNNAGNSNIVSSYTPTVTTTKFLIGDPDTSTLQGGFIETNITNGVGYGEMIIGVTASASILIDEDESVRVNGKLVSDTSVTAPKYEFDYGNVVSPIPTFTSDNLGYTFTASISSAVLGINYNDSFINIANVPIGVWLIQCQVQVYPPFPAGKDVRMFLIEGTAAAGNNVTIQQFDFNLVTPSRSEATITIVHRQDDLKDIGLTAYLHPTQLAGFTTTVYPQYSFFKVTRIA
jgi:hypothetical protein